MKRFLIPALLAFGFSMAPAQQVVSSDLYQLISDLRSAMPGMNSDAFVQPSNSEINNFRDVITRVLAGDYHSADSLAQILQYRLYEWHDSANNDKRYYVLKEPNAENSGGVALGWGTYIFRPEGHDQVIVEAPHPYWDTNTWKVGFRAYQQLDARYFLMAGTHRYANGQNPAPADVAHNTQNMFHTVHQKVAPFSVHALQVHGFSRSSHPGYPDVVLSNGSSNPPAILDSLSNAIQARGFSVGIYDGVNWSDLAATTNTQGQWSRSHDYSFIHMELEYFIRATTSQWQKINAALVETFLTPTGISGLAAGINNPALQIQAMPNPFNPAVTLFYSLPKTSLVSLKIFDINGRLVRLLVDSNKPAGNYRAQWYSRDNHGNPVAAGAYFAVLSAEKNVAVKRILLIK